MVRQRVFDGLYLSTLNSGRLDEILGVAYSVSLFTQWKPGEAAEVEFHVWLKQRLDNSEDTDSTEDTDLGEKLVEPEGPLRGCTECSTKQHPLKGMDPSACTDQESPGPWHERLPHFRLEFTPSAGEELQSEYFVPREHAAEALHALHACSSVFSPLLMVSEVRAIAADSLLLSPHAERHVGANGSVGFHFTWHKREE